VILRINGVSISAVVSPRHPGAVTGLHDRIKGGGEASCRPTTADGRVILKQVRALRSRRMAYPCTLPVRCACGCGCTSYRGSKNLAVPAVAVGFTV
jgi:hypothetical protein